LARPKISTHANAYNYLHTATIVGIITGTGGTVIPRSVLPKKVLEIHLNVLSKPADR